LLSKTRGDEAIPILEKARALAPDLWGPPYYLGRIYLEQGLLKEALSLLDRAAKLNPDESAIQYQLGRALQKAGREAEAQAAFARFSRLKSQSPHKQASALDRVQP
jgi:predicted Zn-dependent protease